jgi:hypothetical protein
MRSKRWVKEVIDKHKSYVVGNTYLWFLDGTPYYYGNNKVNKK